ncbi:MAG: TolC family protein [Chlorobi bacterium]|nr:TolC family protein [Chlorobiota bacterium]
MKKIVYVLCLVLPGVIPQGFSQQKAWTLEECVQYAIDHNITIRQQDINTRYNENQLRQAKINQLPNLNGNSNYSYQQGRALDQSTYSFTQQVNYVGLNLNSSLTLFNGLQTRNTIRQQKYILQASLEDLEKAKNDISVNVALAYLQILLDKELLDVAESQLAVSQQQIKRTKELVEAGSLAAGSLYEIQAQAASEEVQLINARNALDIAYLNMTQLLELDSVGSFDIVSPGITIPDSGYIIPPVSLVYADAQKLMPQVRSAEYSVKRSEIELRIAQGARNPRVSLSGSFNTYFSDNLKKVLGVDPVTGVIYGNYPFGKQFQDNQTFGLTLGLTVPIFNGWQVKTSIDNALLNLDNAQYQLQFIKNQLHKEIQQAYADASGALKKFLASQSTVASAQESFRYTEEKFNVGLVNTVDFNAAKNQLTQAQSDMLSSKYEFIFKVNVLKFYRGQPFKLDIKF